MALTPGTRIGSYEITARIGAGGMGEVYRATDTSLGRQVAVKVLPAAVAQNQERLARFDREARTLASLNHPNIATVHGLERSDGVTALVMELVDGPTLADRIALGAVPFEEAMPIASQMAGALVAAHAQGIVHRDLKPANVKVRPDGHVKVLDFGLAKVDNHDDQATRTAAGQVFGTAAYMSPEQARGEAVDARSDVFSFGVVLYEMLSGRRPFHAASLFETLSAVIHSDPAPLESPAYAFVGRCLAKKPADRYQTAGELRAALEQVRTPQAGPSIQVPSVVVLPFANMSRDADDEFFSDGLSEEIINALVQVPGLKVIARTSAFAFKGKHEDVRKIADTLGVTTVLEGSVRRAGKRLRVTAQLIDATDGSHRWSQRYDRDLEDVFAVQDEIAQAVTTALRTTLSGHAGPVARHTPPLPAYEALLRARYYLQRWTAESMTKGREHLEQAIALDAGYASAHVELGWCLLGLVTENMVSASEAGPLMRASAERALAIDPSLDDAHSVLALAAVLDYDWEEAAHRFGLAMARDPVSPTVRWFYLLYYLQPLRRVDEALAQMERAIQEDPLNLILLAGRGCLLVTTTRHEEGERALRRALELDSGYWLALYWLGISYMNRGRFAEAARAYERGLEGFPGQVGMVGCLAATLERVGETERAARLLQEFGDGTAFGVPFGWTVYYLTRGDVDHAAEWFEKGIAQHDTRMPWFASGVFGADLLVSSPHWERLAKLMNLPPLQV